MKSQKIWKFKENIQIGYKYYLLLRLPSRNKYLAIAVKHYGKACIKVFWSCQILFFFFTLFQIFFPVLQLCYNTYFTAPTLCHPKAKTLNRTSIIVTFPKKLNSRLPSVCRMLTFTNLLSKFTKSSEMYWNLSNI